MITGQELLNLALNNKDYTKARDILKSYGADFTIYSCDKNIISRVIVEYNTMCSTNKNDNFDTLVGCIKLANKTERDINEILIELESKNSQVDALEEFFTAFDDNNTKERLFALIGESGVGKTYLIEKRFPNIPEYACNSSLDPYSLCYYLADKDGTGLKPYETPFLESLKNGGKVYLDEFNELPRDTKMFIQGITDEKKNVVIGDEKVRIHEDFKIIASFNPPSETDERDPLGDAILSRAVGYVLELTDDILMERLNVSADWLNLVRRLYSHCKNSGLIDVRDLNFRDYQRFTKYDFESQFKFKMCLGDVTNIREFKKIQSTGEYQDLLKQIKTEMLNKSKGVKTVQETKTQTVSTNAKYKTVDLPF